MLQETGKQTGLSTYPISTNATKRQLQQKLYVMIDIRHGIPSFSTESFTCSYFLSELSSINDFKRHKIQDKE